MITSTLTPQHICPRLQFCFAKLSASTWHRADKLQAHRMKRETRTKRELYPTPAFGILQIVLALPQYTLAGCHFPGLECQNCLRTLPFFFFFYCFITRLTYQHTQSHMLPHILCIHRGMYLIHMHFILLRQIHLIPLLRTDFEYQQLHQNNLKGSERQRAEKSELRVQPRLTA